MGIINIISLSHLLLQISSNHPLLHKEIFSVLTKIFEFHFSDIDDMHRVSLNEVQFICHPKAHPALTSSPHFTTAEPEKDDTGQAGSPTELRLRTSNHRLSPQLLERIEC